jgi:hypothetical protein
MLILLSAFGSAANATPNLVQNGQFLQTTRSSPGGFVCNVGTTCTSAITSWSSACSTSGSCGTGNTVVSLLFPGTNGSAFNGGNGLWGTIANSPDGGNILASDGDPAYRAPIFQTITGLTAGHTYALRFDQAAAQQNGTSGVTTERWQVTFGGNTQLSPLVTNPSHGFQPWTQQVLNFTASTASGVLNFLALGTPAGEPPVVLLSAVSLTDTSVPEPGTLLLFGSGLVALTVARRRTKRRTANLLGT